MARHRIRVEIATPRPKISSVPANIFSFPANNVMECGGVTGDCEDRRACPKCAQKHVRCRTSGRKRMSVVHQLLQPEIVWVLIPLAAILLGGVLSVTRSLIRHRERMAKIGMGIDPDYEPNLEQSQPDDGSRFGSRR
jgi:hypothetical protein